MPDITITLTDDEMKALEYVAVDPVEWVTNFVKVRCAAAVDEIYQGEVARLVEEGSEHIPVDKAKVVREANVKSAKDRHKEFLENPPGGRPQ